MTRGNTAPVTPDLLAAVTALADAERRFTEQQDALAQARTARNEAHAHRDALIHAELDREIPVVELCKVTGLTRARIYQIRETRPV